MKPKREIVSGKTTPYTRWLLAQDPARLTAVELKDALDQRIRMRENFNMYVERQDFIIGSIKAELKKKKLQIVPN